MNKKFFSRLDRLIAIDLGSSRVRVWSKSKEIVYDEPPSIAISKKTDQVLAIGFDAFDMSGRVGEDIEVQAIIDEGQIVNADLAKAYFKLLFKKVFGEFIIIRPVVMISVPTSIPKTKKELFSEIFYDLGVGEVYTISQTLAAAIGSGVPVAEASGCFILQMGRGVVEASVISMGRVLVTDYSLKAGDYLSKKIAWEVKKDTLLELPQKEIKRIKQFIQIGAKNNKKITVSGHDLKKRVPREIELSNDFLVEIVKIVVDEYVRLLNKVMAKIPAELTTDVIDKGLLLSGTFANLDGFEEYLVGKLKIPVSTVDETNLTVIKGMSLVLDNLQLYKESLGYVS